MEYKVDRRPIKENDLVSEQPGFFVLFLGVFFSVVVGLSIRTAAQSDWFHEHLKEAISNVGKDWRIQHGAVGLYFKDGIKPTIGLYVDNVKIASESSCYMKSGGFAQRVKIPLSMVKYILDGQLVSEVEIQDFKIEITEKTPICDSKVVVENSESGIHETKKKNQIMIVDRVEKSALRNEIERVRINKLEIYYPHGKYDYFSLKDIVIENRSSHPKILFMEGDVDLNPLIKSGEIKKLANLKIEYNEFPEKTIKSNLFGSLREGFFSVQLVNRLDDKKFQLQAELKNVSLSFVSSSLAKDFAKEIPKDINLKSNWVSLKLYAEGLIDALGSASAEVKDVLVNGELGEFSLENLKFSKGIEHGPNPFELKVKGVDLSKVFTLNAGAKIPSQVESLGFLDGQINYAADASIKLLGSIKGFELVFSANSIRKVETVNVDTVTGVLVKKRFELDAVGIKNEQGAIEGRIHFKTNDLKAFEFDAQLRNIKLSKAVSELVTGVDTPVVMDDVGLKFHGTTSEVNYKVQGKLKSVSHQYFDIANVGFSVSGSTGKNQEIDVKADSWHNTEMAQTHLQSMGLEIPSLLNKPKVKMTQAMEGILLRFDSQNLLKMSVTVDNSKNVSGVIAMKDQEWKVYGTRDSFKIDKK